MLPATEATDWTDCVRAVVQTELYREAAAAIGVTLSSSPLRSSVLMDGVRWVGQDALAHARSFAVHGRVATPSSSTAG